MSKRVNLLLKPEHCFSSSFPLQERPKWLEVKSVNELKTKLGHVIVMLLLIGFFEKTKTTSIQSPLDLLCFSTVVLLCSRGKILGITEHEPTLHECRLVHQLCCCLHTLVLLIMHITSDGG